MTQSAHDNPLPLEFYRGQEFRSPAEARGSPSGSQLPLGFARHDVYTFASYIPGVNAGALEALRQIATDPDHANVYLWGAPGTGKTHLLQAACNLAAQRERPCAYIPLRQLDNFTPDLFAALEELSLVCLDDVDELAGRDEWELALFNLFNRLRDARTPLLVSAGHSPKASPVRLPDLQSRLCWGLCYHLQALHDDENIVALKQRARQRGFELSDPVVEFLIKRVARDTRNLFLWLDHLDRRSLEAQRKLTVDFVRKMLDNAP
ncbi:MAG: DnaA regulatory inactivator Hda [Gammaproteobacteria bacterium]|nr:DnaA regulatory inactivator Hda [Gammaproteobacteria bacterium]